MRRTYSLLSALLALLLLPAAAALGQLSNYYFATSTGDPTTMSTPTVLFSGSSGDGNTRYSFSIGFTFRFNGVNYSTITVSSNGVAYLATSSLSDPNNSFTSAPRYPFIAPFWDDLRMGRGINVSTCNPRLAPRIQYQRSGTAPNRMLTIEWKEIKLGPHASTRNFMPMGTFQLRLYEGSNRIEVWYGAMSSCDICNRLNSCITTSASIGIAASSSQFISVSFPSGTPTADRTTPNNSVNINTATGGSRIEPNTTLVFGECYTVLNGRIGEDNGGTTTLNNGDTFFSGFLAQVGESAVYRPFDMRMISAICTSPYTLSISGPAAADYYFGTPGTQVLNGTLPATGESYIPEITFRPTATGVRQATLTVTSLGVTRTFNLAATAPFVNYTADLSQGGTPGMKSGTVLLQNLRIRRNTSTTYTPFTLTNMSGATQQITFNITGGDGQYSITPGGPLAPGETITPVITFDATGFGVQEATLEVNAGGQIRTFTLEAISTAPGGEFRIGNTAIDTSTVLFTNTYTCIGSEVQVLEVEVENIGYEDYKISGVVFYETDTVIRQGIPRYAFRRDAQGNLIVSRDYVVTLTPPTLPYTPGPGIFPVTLTESQKMKFYISFIGTSSGKRYARGYFHTNGENTASPSTEGVLTDGLIAFDVFGRGSGARLSGDMNGQIPKTVSFPATRLGESTESTLRLVNPGVCSLRISIPKLAITAGDVGEFSILSMPAGFVDPVTSDLVLAPGESTEMKIRFAPARTGSRRASLRIATNDSSIHVPGVSEKGVYYADLYGIGGTDVYLDDIMFGEVIMGAVDSEQPRDVVRVVNAMETPFTINAVEIEGADAGEFRMDPAKPWPTTSRLMQPGEEIELGIIFAPVAGGTPGERNAALKLTTTLPNPTPTAELKGIAGTRTMEVGPASITFTPMTMGRQQRRMVTITNTGTMKIRVNQPEITGPEALNFHISTLARLELNPGQTEYLEVTYMPLTVGTFAATLEVTGNASDAPQQVLLNGTAFMRGPDGNDGHTPVTNIEDGVGRNPDMAVSGLERESTVSGITLHQSVPNPANEVVEISYSLARATDVELGLYDAQGRLVRLLYAGAHSNGLYNVRVDISDLPVGTYHYRLTAEGATLTRKLHIVR